MAYTLAEFYKVALEGTDFLKMGVIGTILRKSKAMEVIPWRDVTSLENIAVRYNTLPDVSFRRINEGYTPSEGTTEQVGESVYGFGGEVKFDRIFKKVKNTVQDPYTTQVNMKLASVAMTFSDYLINGDHGVDEDGFEGLKKRAAGMDARQTVNVGGSGAAALDPLASTTNAAKFLNKLEEAHYRCQQGDVGAIFCNEGMYWGLGQIIRFAQAGGAQWLDLTKDSFDREILTYKNSPLIDVGKKRDQSTEIITDTEVAGDAGNDATSMYFASFDPVEGVTGIQLDGMEIYDPLSGGEQESTPTTLMRIDWWIGLANLGKFGLVRMMNFEGASNW